MKDNGDVDSGVHGVVDKVSDFHVRDLCLNRLGGR